MTSPNKRSPSPLTLMKKLAADGVATRLTLPDGSVLETLTSTETVTVTEPPQNAWDRRLNEISSREVRTGN